MGEEARLIIGMHASTYHLNRVRTLKKQLGQTDLEGVVIGPGSNLYYYMGISALILDRPHLLFVPRDSSSHVVVPKLEAGQYESLARNVTSHVWNDGDGPTKAFDDLANELSISRRWGIDGSVPFRYFHYLFKYSEGDGTFREAEPILRKIRAVKDDSEVKLMKKGLSILCGAYMKIPDLLKVGVTEAQLARVLSDYLTSQGTEVPHEPMVQAGGNAANPHSFPSPRKIKRGDSVVVDIVCKYGGYFADMARTFIIGNDKRVENIYAKVLEAQEQAINVANTGSLTGDVDSVAREYLKQQRLDHYFIHRTGHGLGLDSIEDPDLIPDGQVPLEPSMIFNVEPGVYIPGKLGVRIEDELITTRNGHAEISSKLPKEYGWWR